MKIPQAKQRRHEQGYILLMTLTIAVALGITLGSYFVMVNQEDQTVVRSQCWNGALALAEAGVDEALAQMNSSPNLFSANGWGSSNATTYGPVTRTLTNGTYTVYISTSGAVPAIYSTGAVPVPNRSQKVNRTVEVTTTINSISPFFVGMGAVGNINMNGNSTATDSWNSETNTLSTNGLYSPNMTSTNGNVASEGGIVNIGNQTIEGNLFLGPTATYSSANSQVTGTIYYDDNVQFPDVTLPATDYAGNTISWQPAPVTNTGTVKKPVNVHDFTSANSPGTNNYFLVSDSDTIVVEAGVTVTVQVTNVSSFSPSSITLNGGTTNSGTMVMYDDAGSATLGGNSTGGAIGNRPENFVFLGLPGFTDITFGGTSTFVGAIYAPEVSLKLNGGGNANNIEGAVIVNNVTLNGHFDFHYDVSLANWTAGPGRGFVPTSWQEIY
jgi:hypothetical protein